MSDVVREIIVRLKSKHDEGLSSSKLLNELGFVIALEFDRNELDFDFCDRVANDLFATMSSIDPGETDLLMKIFLAFDSGEYDHDEDHSIHPIDRFTRPRIAEIIKECTPKV